MEKALLTSNLPGEDKMKDVLGTEVIFSAVHIRIHIARVKQLWIFSINMLALVGLFPQNQDTYADQEGVNTRIIIHMCYWNDTTFENKYCQRHNGPEGWVQLTKETSLGHITSSYTQILIKFHLQNLDQSQLQSLSISNKLEIQNLDQP